MKMKMKMHNLNQAAKQKGIGLIELLLSISIIAVIVIGAVVLFGSANESSKAQEMTKQYTTLNSTVHSMFGSQPSYGVAGADLAASLAASNALPDAMVNGAVVQSPFGAMTVVVAANNRQFDTTYAADTIPNPVCSKFVPTLIGSVRTITIGGVNIATAADAITNCAIVAASGNTAGAIVVTAD